MHRKLKNSFKAKIIISQVDMETLRLLSWLEKSMFLKLNMVLIRVNEYSGLLTTNPSIEDIVEKEVKEV